VTLTVPLAGSQPAGETESFGGEYSQLSQGQQRLIDDFYHRVGQVTGKEFDPETCYNRLRFTERTTLEAVTNALEKTQLTDPSGASLGTALDLIENVEEVHGKVEETRGDLQFCIYARLIPDALDKLNRSQEFERQKDNSRYHKGYPLNYRQTGEFPSIQISMAQNGQRADIDVDYRSSKIPQALFNGHLTAANSDVRAGNNHERHLTRWAGLMNWWTEFFGLPIGSEQMQTRGATVILLWVRE